MLWNAGSLKLPFLLLSYDSGYIFFPRVILFNFFFSLLIYGGLGFWGWGLRFGFLGCGFQLIGFGACDVGPSGFFGLGLSYKHKRITLGKEMVQIYLIDEVCYFHNLFF